MGENAARKKVSPHLQTDKQKMNLRRNLRAYKSQWKAVIASQLKNLC